MLELPRQVALVLLRRGGYAIGLFQGEALIASKTGTRYVQGRQRAGGSSAPRFARRRAKQVHELLKEACQEAQEKLSPHEATIERVFLGGDWLALRRLQQGCPLLARLAAKTAHRVLNVPEPRQAVLAQALHQAWSSTVVMVPAEEVPERSS
ncbi:MAG: hypothetical protein HY683_03490 [Chloroflexi bacterium]|nr:hypothetical protein [Chloroflexota bacterium]